MPIDKRKIANSLRGRKANAKGEMFERLIEMSCRHYRRFDIADIQKTPEPMRIIRPINRAKGTFEAHFEKQAQPDFKGVLKGGQAILFEAKRTESTNIAKDRLSAEQIKNLESAARLGAKCFVLVSFHERNFYKVPWDVWSSIQERFNKKSVNQKDLTSHEVTYRNGIINFLEGESNGTIDS